MKKLTHIWILSLLLAIGCGDNKQAINNLNVQATHQTTENGETLFITKVTAAFHKIIQDDKAWKKLQFVFEDHLMLTSLTIKDDVLPNAFLTIRDDIFLSAPTLEETEHNGMLFSDRLVKEYNSMYQEKISFNDIKERLNKLHFSIPKSVLNNNDEWNNEGRPVSATAYEFTKNPLKKIQKEDAEDMIGSKNLDELIRTSQVESPNFYFLKDERGLFVIAESGNQGALFTKTRDQKTIESFEINDHTLFNTITLRNGREESTHFRRNLVDQTYVPTPEVCKGFYVFHCDSQAFTDYRNLQQAQANKTCETIWQCIPCCSVQGGIIYMSMIFEPEPKKCQKHETSVEVISFLPFTSGNDNT